MSVHPDANRIDWERDEVEYEEEMKRRKCCKDWIRKALASEGALPLDRQQMEALVAALREDRIVSEAMNKDISTTLRSQRDELAQASSALLDSIEYPPPNSGRTGYIWIPTQRIVELRQVVAQTTEKKAGLL